MTIEERYRRMLGRMVVLGYEQVSDEVWALLRFLWMGYR